jgi:hypothetical protein
MINAIMNERQIEFALKVNATGICAEGNFWKAPLTVKEAGCTIVLRIAITVVPIISSTRDASATSGAAFDTYLSTNFNVYVKTLDTYNIAYQTADYFFGIPTKHCKTTLNLPKPALGAAHLIR